jgi:hypothetical protein
MRFPVSSGVYLLVGFLMGGLLLTARSTQDEVGKAKQTEKPYDSSLMIFLQQGAAIERNRRTVRGVAEDQCQSRLNGTT